MSVYCDALLWLLWTDSCTLLFVWKPAVLLCPEKWGLNMFTGGKEVIGQELAEIELEV